MQVKCFFKDFLFNYEKCKIKGKFWELFGKIYVNIGENLQIILYILFCFVYIYIYLYTIEYKIFLTKYCCIQ